jgi:hypothetical protein
MPERVSMKFPQSLSNLIYVASWGERGREGSEQDDTYYGRIPAV